MYVHLLVCYLNKEKGMFSLLHYTAWKGTLEYIAKQHH